MTNQEIVALYEQGWNKKKIRRECGLTLERVDEAIRHIPGAINLPVEETCLAIVEDYRDGMRFEAIRKKYSVHGSTLNNIFYFYGVEKVRKRKRGVNRDFFETIDNEEKAYWLGFLFADGYNEERRGYIEISLSAKDEEHLQKFQKAIESEHPIAKRNIKGYESVRLNFCSRKMSNDLAKHGCVQAKSLILEFPTTVPEELTHHFIRGYFDGDGSVSVNVEKGQYNVTCVGTESFLERICQEANMPKTKLGKKGNAFTLQHGGRGNAGKIYDYLYRDATIYLERKRDKFLLCQKLPSPGETSVMMRAE